MAAPVKSLKWYKELKDKKGRVSAGAFLVEGEKAIRQISANHPQDIAEILAVADPPADLRQRPIRAVSASQFQYISTSRTPQGIAAVVKIPPEVYSARLPAAPGLKILLLEDIQDPGNAGTLIRTAAAFNFSGVVLTDKCADPFSPRVVQATAGAVLSVWLRVTPQYLDLVRSLLQNGYHLAAALLDGKDGPDILRRDKLILALGNEAAGLSPGLRQTADFHVGLPIARDRAESLNAAVCGGILMYLSKG
jgi:TrmH family RNA methyltransferase